MEEKDLEVKEDKNVVDTKPDRKSTTLYFINLIILVAVIAFSVLGLVFRIASLHFRVIYHLEGGTISTFFSISEIFLILALLSSIGLGVYNFIMVFVEKTREDKRRNTIYVITAIAVLTLLVLILNLL